MTMLSRKPTGKPGSLTDLCSSLDSRVAARDINLERGKIEGREEVDAGKKDARLFFNIKEGYLW